MYLNCPKCKENVRMPDFPKNENEYEEIKCFNCNSKLMYNDRSSKLVTKKWFNFCRRKGIKNKPIMEK